MSNNRNYAGGLSLKFPNKWGWGRKLAKLQATMNAAAFRRLLREVVSSKTDLSEATLWRWIRDAKVLDREISNHVAGDQLIMVTKNGEGLVSVNEDALSAKYAAAIKKYPVPPRGTSVEDCRDWALEVRAAADHYVNGGEGPESWQVQTAKARFSELFRRARTQGPQRITRQGKEGVVMLAEEEYERLVGTLHQPKNLVQFFRKSPLVGLELEFDRDREPAPDIDL